MASELARARATVSNIRRRQEEATGTLLRTAFISGAALAQGFAESKGGLKLSYFGVPTKIMIGTGFKLAEAVSSDKSARRLFGAIADAEIAAYFYNAARSESLIAGEGGNL